MKNKMMACAFALVLLLALPLSAYALTVTPETVSVYVGDTVRLEADAASGVTWRSLNERVATVEDGVVKGVNWGTVTIRATDIYDATDDVTVHVYTHSHLLIHTTMEVGEGADEENRLEFSQIPEGMAVPKVTWESSDKNVVTVESKTVGGNAKASVATFHGVAPGVATVTVTINKGGAHEMSEKCNVTVPGIVFDEKNIKLVEGNSTELTMTTYGDFDKSHYEWTCEPATVASVDSTGRVTAIGEGTATVTVKSNDGMYKDTCTITVETSKARPITAGTIENWDTIEFADLIDDLNSRSRDKLKSDIEYITNLVVEDDAGSIFYGYVSPSDHGAGIGTVEKFYTDGAVSTRKRIDKLSFAPTSGFFGTATISYKGYNSNMESFAGEIFVTVKQSDGIVYTISKGEVATMETADFNDFCATQNGRALTSVEFSLPDASKGTLYYNYVNENQYEKKVTSSQRYLRTGVPYLDSVSFVPNATFSGEVVIRYTGYDTSNLSHEGKVTIHVLPGEEDGMITLRTGENTPVVLPSADFNAASRAATGENLSYIEFDSLPKSDVGVFYYNYVSAANYGSAVSTSAHYYRSSTPALSSVAFVPAAGYVGSFTVRYTGCDVEGEEFDGTIRVVVSEEGGVISYETEIRTPVTFDVADFNEVCRGATGENLSRVRFTLPPAAKGTLYYEYDAASKRGTSVSATAYYYRNAAPLISSLTFVPAEGCVGTVEIAYVGYDLNNETYSGKVEITVGSDEADVTYMTSSATPLKFSSADFNDVCLARHGCSLRYVTFSLPASSQGKLYSSYSSSTKKGTELKSTTKCYRSGSPSISNIVFVPNESFSGAVSIAYTAYDANGASYRGSVNITVGTSAMTSIFYSTERNAPIGFNADDFDAVSVAATGYHVRSVRFTLPSSSVGTLYYRYKNASSVGTKASAYTSYYRNSSQLIDDLTFVPAKDYGGTVNIAYIATDINGTTFGGVVTIDVSGVAGTVTYTTYYNMPVTFSVNAFNDVCLERFGENLRYVTFTLPSAARGILYSDYRSINDYGTRVRADTQYYRTSAPLISAVTFVPATGFSGTAAFDFEGCSVSGRTFTGSVSITVRESTLPFSDMSSYSWAEEAVSYLYTRGIVAGIPDGGTVKYAPGNAISRGDFALMLYRAYHLAPQGTELFSDVSRDAYYADAVRTLKTLDIVRGDDTGRFRPTESLTRQDAMVMMLRAMRSVGGWFVDDGTQGDLYGFTDRGDIAPYAVGAIGALVELNVIRGSGSGALFPRQTLTRAEMAVILHRALTL